MNPTANQTDSVVSEPSSASAERSDPRSFWALTATMFQGALSDNIYKFILVMLVISLANVHAARALAAQGHEAVVGLQVASTKLAAKYKMVVDIAFILPYVLGVAVAGWLADRFSKTRVTRWTKVLEFVVMSLAALTFAFGALLVGEAYVWIGVAVLFLMGMQSALFSPSKYGILPELLPSWRLGWANGIMQGFTFLAIIIGTIVGPWLFGVFEKSLWIPGVMLVVLAAVGYGSASMMSETPVANREARFDVNFLPMLVRCTGHILRDTGLKWGVAGLAVWWMAAAMLQGSAVLMATNVLDLSPARAGIALLPIVAAMGAGCFLTGLISKNRIELGLVPFGAVGMFVTCMIVWLATPAPDVIEAMKQQPGGIPTWFKILLPMLIGAVGFTMGFFIVPLEAFVVHQSDPTERGGIWAVSNVYTAVGMVLGAVLQMVLTLSGNPGDVFLGGGIIMLVTGAIICWRFPRIPLRFLILCVFSAFYRTRVKGAENVPKTGGALLAPNHQSYLDAILLSSILDRPIRFIMSEQVYSLWFVYPFARLTNSIPIERSQSPRELIAALREAGDEIRRGGLVCIFPEGQLTRNGMLMPFRRGIERIVKDLDAPIVPVAIDGAYDTGMALRAGSLHPGTAMPWRRMNINVVFGEPVSPRTPLHALRQSVTELMVDAFSFRKADVEPLHRMAIRSLRAGPLEKRYADHASDGMVTNAKILATIVLLGTRYRAEWAKDESVGILLPPSIGAMALNIAALLAGKLPVNLNYTASLQINTEICRTARINVIFTSRLFIEKAKLELPADCRVVYLEDLKDKVTTGERVAAMLRGLFLPVASLERFLGRTRPATMDDVATLIFSSGSTGVPKGVMLTHWNVTSNGIGAAQYVNVTPAARLICILPFFHSFGYTAALWLPLLKRFSVTFHPNPLDAKVIGALVERDGVTHLFATPTFLSAYIRRVESSQFGSLQFVLTGAEKLREAIAMAFLEKFGLMPKEGFGCTECSPIVALNGDDWREPGIYQVGTRRGTVGQPIPGVCLRILHLNNGEPVPPGEPGMLFVRGANVMLGYYGMPEKTAEVLRDGWYQTGDVARLDEDGFLTITDRLSRFSKIGGEMVPHIRIEESLQQLTGIEEQVFAVTGIPDEKKGERLVVLYTIPEGKAKQACDQLSSPELNLPALWIPKWADYVKIDAIPALGSGKMDLRQIKQVAMEKLGVEGAGREN